MKSASIDGNQLLSSPSSTAFYEHVVNDSKEELIKVALLHFEHSTALVTVTGAMLEMPCFWSGAFVSWQSVPRGNSLTGIVVSSPSGGVSALCSICYYLAPERFVQSN
jgi:hypothetical protein